MNLTPQDLSREVTSTGFGGEQLEKVFRLIALLDALNSHPFLKTRIALKGGTALNLFYFDVPRLSVDIDLNYIGAADRETMLVERPKLEQAVQAVCSREGLTVKRMPSDHAGGKWRIAEMDLWDQEAIDLVGPAFIAFGGQGGQFRFIAVDGCRGWAKLQKDGSLSGRIYIHHGDDSGFKAVPFEEDEKPAAKGASRAKRGLR